MQFHPSNQVFQKKSVFFLATDTSFLSPNIDLPLGFHLVYCSNLENINSSNSRENRRKCGSNRLRWLNKVFDTSVSFSFSSKTLDPLVAKNGSKQVNNTNFNFLIISKADVCAVAMAT